MDLRDGDLHLRVWRESDVPAVLAACQDPEIPRWIPLVPFPYGEEDARAYVHACLQAHDSAGPRYPFAIADFTSDALLGSIDMGTNAMQTGNIGYWVAREARGRGIATRALKLLRRWSFDKLGLGRLELLTDPDNVASQRVTVGTVVGLLASGHSATEILLAYPYLEPDDILAALSFAAWRAEEIDVPLRTS